MAQIGQSGLLGDPVVPPFNYKFNCVDSHDRKKYIHDGLHHRANIDEAKAHKIIEEGLMGVAGLSQSMVEMKAYSAISGFRDDELPLFWHKLDFLADAISSQIKEQNFQRVIDLAGLPDFRMTEGAVSVEKLLKVRDSSEAREFRDWLGGLRKRATQILRRTSRH